MNNTIEANTSNFNIMPNSPFGAIITPVAPEQHIDSLSVERLRLLVRQYNLLILRGFQSGFKQQKALVSFASKWGTIMMWPFGPVLDVMEHPDATDHVFDNSYMPFHWDGMYKPTVPELLLFHCVTAPSEDEGGRTTFVNTTRLLNDADPVLLSQWKAISITYRIRQMVHYGGEVNSPLIVQHPNGQDMILRYNEPARKGKQFLNHHSLEISGIPEEKWKPLQERLHQYLYDSRYYYAHQWHQGDIVVADNFVLLHGREGFTSRAMRHLQRIHIQNDPVYLNTSLRLAST